MSKLLNDDVINYLRNKSQNTFDPNKYEPGETFIAQRPSRKGKLNAMKIDPIPEGRHPDCIIEDPFKDVPSTDESDLDDDDDDYDALRGAGDAGADFSFGDFLAGITPTQMSQLCTKCSSCSKLGAPTRRILGPFPDEPIMAAVDKILTFLGINFRRKEEELPTIDEESDASYDEADGSDSGTEGDVDGAFD